jgi:iron-sulfur cluster assembly protein
VDIELTEKAVAKIKEIIASSKDAGGELALQVSIVGGGCSGFSYKMEMKPASSIGPDDKVFEFPGLKVYADQASMMYLVGTKIDYVESLEGTGFKFENPNATRTCGCGESFSI